MAALACSSSPEPRVGLVDRTVGLDASTSEELGDRTTNLVVSLAGLLNPKTWDLPGWNDTQ
jgi:hypothetical protein